MDMLGAHQRYREHPLAVGCEATYTRAFRSWSLQFYPAVVPHWRSRGTGL
ncbi:MAG: 3-ketosteroid 9alpha-monooxygenase subunit [Mycobacterium sp.]|jgi:hypothetical protein|nr:3-ketosteroid 9alpha-monooxygenase subunit [Mycobacterium sp.]